MISLVQPINSNSHQKKATYHTFKQRPEAAIKIVDRLRRNTKKRLPLEYKPKRNNRICSLSCTYPESCKDRKTYLSSTSTHSLPQKALRVGKMLLHRKGYWKLESWNYSQSFCPTDKLFNLYRSHILISKQLSWHNPLSIGRAHMNQGILHKEPLASSLPLAKGKLLPCHLGWSKHQYH